MKFFNRTYRWHFITLFGGALALAPVAGFPEAPNSVIRSNAVNNASRRREIFASAVVRIRPRTTPQLVYNSAAANSKSQTNAATPFVLNFLSPPAIEPLVLQFAERLDRPWLNLDPTAWSVVGRDAQSLRILVTMEGQATSRFWRLATDGDPSIQR